MRKFLARIDQAKSELGINDRYLTEKAGINGSYFSNLRTGKSKNPQTAEIKRIAVVLKKSVAYLTGETDNPSPEMIAGAADGPIPIIATAEAGTFRELPEIQPEFSHELPTVNAAHDPNHPRARHFAVEVRGDSMNAAKPFPLFEGMAALCVDVEDAGIEIENGRIYVVIRTRDGGHTWETTIKRIRVYKDRYELCPESTNPKHKPIAIPRSRGDEFNSKEIKAIGLVYNFCAMKGI